MSIDSNQFSEREKDVINLLLQGKSNKQISLGLGISNRTVEFHLGNIYAKLGVTSRTEAFLKFTESNLWKSTGNVQVNSTVEQIDDSTENGVKSISRRISMKSLYYIIGGGLLTTTLIVFSLVTKLPTQSFNPTTALGVEQTTTISTLPISTQTAEINPAQQPLEFDTTTYGITVTAKSLCTDGMNTILYLDTILDSNLWKLSQTDFFPIGKTYFETSINFLENDIPFSDFSSGKRDDPIFNTQNNMVSTIQLFVFPKTPLPNSTFTIEAKVALLDLPSTFIPPIPMDFLEPGIIVIPLEYVTYATIGDCE
jgi:DNA-binding CsgD family transcriptional regulator